MVRYLIIAAERILKIGWYLAKSEAKREWHLFSGHGVWSSPHRPSSVCRFQIGVHRRINVHSANMNELTYRLCFLWWYALVHWRTSTFSHCREILCKSA